MECPPSPKGNKFFACLTHDVDNGGIKNHKADHTIVGFLYRAVIISVGRFLGGEYSLESMIRNWKAAASLPLVYLGFVSDYWRSFKEYVQIEREHPSTFFLVPFKGREGRVLSGSAPCIRAVKYEASDLKDEIEYVLCHGGEIGVHGIDSWLDAEAGRGELDKIRKLTGETEIGVRMHWLYHCPDSCSFLEDAGYSYDSTSGYNECIGFRAGTLQVFKPLNVKNLLELPMHVMDTALFYPDRMNLKAAEGVQAINECIKEALEHGGVLTLNWHDRSIAPERLWGWAYIKALQELEARGAKFLTAGNTVGWFRKRRAIQFEHVEFDGSSFRVNLKFPAIEPSDGILLRTYPPQEDFSRLEYRDIPIHGENGAEVSV